MESRKKCILGGILNERKLSQVKAAEMTGVPQTVISRYIRGSTSYNIDYLYALKKGLNLNSIEDLFTDENDENNE